MGDPFLPIVQALKRDPNDWATIDGLMRRAMVQAGVDWRDMEPFVSSESLEAWFPTSRIEMPATGRRVVYFVSVDGGSYVKIGQSRHLARRLAEFDRLSPHEVTLDVWVPYTDGLESRLHDRFSYCCAKGEWFIRTRSLDGLIASLREGVPMDDLW